MPLKSIIEQDKNNALKEKNEAKLSTLRMLWSEIKNTEINKQHEISDEEVLEIIFRQVKQLKEAAKEFESGGRSDLAEKNEVEISVLKIYLPEQISDEELEKKVKEVIAETGSFSKQDFGKVMGMVMGKVKDQADGGRVKEIVGKMLK